MKSAILCVDDDNTVLETLRSVLGEHYRKEYLIEVAESGEEALDLLEELAEDGIDLKLVISDYIMPVMKGDELLIRMHEKHPRTVKIMLTGQSSIDGVVNAINYADLYRFITKPWDNNDLIMTVQNALKSYDQENLLEKQNKQLRALNDELEKRVVERTKELSDLNENLQERVNEEVRRRHKQEQLLQQQSKMATMGEMIAVIAHQWRQPLSAIALLSQEIGEIINFEKGEPEKLLLVQDRIMNQIEHMDHTINDFKNFFKPSIETKMFKAGKMAREVYKLLEAKMQALKIKLEVHDEVDFDVFGYPNEYKQVVMNLYNNACDILSEKRDSGRLIELFCEQDGEKRIVRVRDNGGGIPDELLPDKLFEAYTSTKGEKGTGIGLQICKTIIEEKFGGKLWAHNVEGGAEFVMEFTS